MTQRRYFNRFRLGRVCGSGPWLLACGHTYLPLHSAVAADYLDRGKE
jgi:hypothetical protein